MYDHFKDSWRSSHNLRKHTKGGKISFRVCQLFRIIEVAERSLLLKALIEWVDPKNRLV